MTRPSVLPPDFDTLLRDAVRLFWETRSGGSDSQGGTRGNVIAGKNLDGFLAIAQAVATHCGLPEDSLFTRGRANLNLPGYFRPNKNWDVVIVHESRLVAALELKSQVGSFGNNFNNRAEEALGNATDFVVAAEKGVYHPARHATRPDPAADPRQPFLGYLMVLEDVPASADTVRRASSKHFDVLPELREASYATRYKLLCERMMERKLYAAAALLLSPPTTGHTQGEHRNLSVATSARNLFAQLGSSIVACLDAAS